MTRHIAQQVLCLAVLAFAGLHAPARAEARLDHAIDEAATAQEINASEDRLLIVNGNSGRVIYDDGRNDLFCVTRRVIVGYQDDGRPIRKRTMRCR